MALNPAQKELLAVVRYFNEQVENKNVARLVAKLSKDFGPKDVRALTGFGENEIKVLVNSVERKPRSKPKVADKSDVQGTKLTEPQPLIILDGDSPAHEHIAYEMSMQIGAKFKSGDRFYSTREGMDAFGFDKNVIQGALAILREKNLIEYRDGSFRKGYIVK